MEDVVVTDAMAVVAVVGVVLAVLLLRFTPNATANGI